MASDQMLGNVRIPIKAGMTQEDICQKVLERLCYFGFLAEKLRWRINFNGNAFATRYVLKINDRPYIIRRRWIEKESKNYTQLSGLPDDKVDPSSITVKYVDDEFVVVGDWIETASRAKLTQLYWADRPYWYNPGPDRRPIGYVWVGPMSTGKTYALRRGGDIVWATLIKRPSR